ncbi:BTAD domain-containing putative transcriptional regulator [Nonomuraea guangzhouensis]|uniref:BTAD domain-containing putative transcriptional regulator n=1 Tax=Nonomuraea guangzhouensis TaxID=1291555 RepID=UPI001C5E1A3B|nr:BTAD domain-containing putative transcriptional regulator [Nonomuraea guangzhouensis]
MRFEILGPARVLDEDGEPVVLGGPRVRGLLTLLALDAGRVVGAERLAAALYGPEPPEGVANALQAQVSRLRRALGRDQVEFHPAGYRLAADPQDVDAHRFERLAGAGRQALDAGDPRRAAPLLREALALWQGPPLADAPHAEAAAAGLEELRLAAVEDRVQADLELGAHRELVAELRRLTAAHPLRERMRAQLMRALYGSGRQAEALTAYDDARRILDEELGVEPGAELAAAQLAVLRADPSLAATAAPVSRQGLRAQLTSFVGRAEELRQVGAQLTAARLVTLIGPGGAGKTRLVLEAAEQATGDVCFVQLAPVTSPADVPKAVLAALGIRDTRLSGHDRPPAVDPVSHLLAALADRGLLLVLDNCEHLIAAVAELADLLLASCPALRVLATSREALGITGESILPVAPLRLPPPDAANPFDYPAVRLFADRAAAVRQPVDETNLAQVAGICRALDGLPLAIELAAARLRTMSVGDVAARLDDRFRLLARGSRTALPRHQTLRAVVAWSWDLLDEREQRMARRLTVFVGGATPASAERVCGLPEEVLFSLAEKSLVEVVDGRYRMLETIRAFCAEQLAESGETEAMREAHAAHYLALAVEADGHLRTAEQLEWLSRLDEESGNLAATIRWSAETGRTALGLRILAYSACYWWMRGHRGTSADLAHGLLAGMGQTPPAGLQEEYALCVLVAAWGRQPGDDLRARLKTLHRLLPAEYLSTRLEFLTMMLPMFTGPPDDYEGVRKLMAQYAGALPPWSQALTHCGVAFMLQIMGRGGDARAEFERSLAEFRAVGERWGTTLALSGLAELAYEQGDYAVSRALADQGLRTSQELGSVADMAECLCLSADSVARLGDLDEARAGYLRAAEMARRIGSGDTLAKAHVGLGELAVLRGDLGEARALMEQALAECSGDWYSSEEVRARIQTGLTGLAEIVSER